MKTPISTDRGPRAIGPYSQAILAKGFLFLSGQVPLDPATQQLVAGGIAQQTERVLENLKGVLEAAGSSLDPPSPRLWRAWDESSCTRRQVGQRPRG